MGTGKSIPSNGSQEDGREHDPGGRGARLQPDDHIETEALAALAEGRVEDALAERYSAHLASCRSCMAAYVDAVRYRAAWLTTRESFTPTGATLREGARAVSRQGHSRWSATASRRVAALALVVVVAGVGLLARQGVFLRSRFSTDPTAELHDAIALESALGLVLPGGESAADQMPSSKRGGADSGEPPLADAVRRASRRYERGDRSANSAYAVSVGNLAVGDLKTARLYVDEGLRSFPKDRKLVILDATIRYRSSDLAGAEARLRDALRSSPADPLATLDLGLVLADQGRQAEARSLLESLRSIGADPALLRRAEQELGRLDRP